MAPRPAVGLVEPAAPAEAKRGGDGGFLWAEQCGVGSETLLRKGAFADGTGWRTRFNAHIKAVQESELWTEIVRLRFAGGGGLHKEDGANAPRRGRAPGLYRMSPLSRKEVEGTESAGLIPAPHELRRSAGGSATEKARGMVHLP